MSLGAALADIGYRVLVVDLDPQGNASTGLGIRHEARASTVYDVVVAEAPLEGAVVETQVARLHAVPATIDLAGAEIELVSQFSRESRLKKALEPIRENTYDFVLLDCPPSLGLLTVNALTAAEELIVPIQCEYYALEGLGQLLRNVSLVQQNINPGLRLSGIVMTMFDPRTKLSEQVVAEVRRFFGELVYDVIIPRTVRLSEAPGFGQPITVYDPRSKGAETYRELAREVAYRPPPESPMPSFDDLPSLVVAPFDDTVTRPPEEEEEASVEIVEEPAEPASSTSSTTVTTEPEPELQSAPADAPVDAPKDAPEERIEERATTPASVRPIPPPEQAEEDIWEDDADDSPPGSTQAARPDQGERRVLVIDEGEDLDIVASKEPLVGPSGRDDGGEQAVVPIGATLEHEEAGPRRRWRLFRKGGDG